MSKLMEVAQRVLENLTTSTLLFDERLRLVYINPAGEMLLAASARQVQGSILGELMPAAKAFVAAVEKALASGHPYTERELRLDWADGRVITVDCTITPLLETHQPPALLMELLHVDRHLRIAREEHLLAQHQAARALVRGLAHEIKNPLGGLRGAAQLLERELPDEELKEYTRIIILEADRLQNLMNRMLGPNALPQKRAINIHEVLEHVRGLVRAEAGSQSGIDRDYDPSIPLLYADPDMLIQAVLNIVRNALQALSTQTQGNIQLRSRAQRQVTIGHRRHKLVVRIEISDNGPGIPPDMIENIFYPMVTGRANGTGLGLSIAQSLVNQHNGLIECASRPGHTVFTILLPLESPDEQT
ncbi:MAG: nitrogen regulation protein NR(II) [Gammaproteobacteria bacterium]